MSHRPRSQEPSPISWPVFAVGLAFWLFIIVGAPALVGFLHSVVEPWLPR